MRRPNVRFLAICAAIAVFIVLMAHIVHGFQTRRTAKILLVQARQLREKGDLGGAIGYYQRYVQLTPDDTPALAEYGMTLAELPKAKTNAMMVLDQVLRREPNYPDVRRRLVDVAMRAGNYSDAKVHLQNHLLKEHPEDGELWFLLGQCQQADQEFEGAAASDRQAIQYKPDLWEAYSGLALLLRRHLEQPGEADKIINAMVDKNPEAPDVYYTRGRYWLEYGRPGAAMADADKAVSLSDKNVQYLLLAATVAQELKKLDKAEEYAARARQLNSHDPKVYLVASQLAVLRSESDKAVELLKQGLTARPNNTDLLWELANLQIDRSEFEAARKTVKNLYRASNDHTLPDFLEGRILLQQGDVLSAVANFEKLRSALSNRPDLQKLNDFSLGQCYDRIGYPDQKVAAYRRTVEDDPEWLPGRMNLAAALVSVGRIDEAIENYQRVLQAAKGSSPAWQELARLQIIQQLHLPKERRNWQRVDDALNNAAKITPNAPTLAIIRAEMLVAQDQSDRAAELLAKACENQPKSADLWIARAALASRQGKTEDARKWLDEAESKLGDSAAIRLERIRNAISLDHKAAIDKLATLQKGWEKFSRDDQFALARQMALAYGVLGATEQSEAAWSQAMALRPEYLPAYLFLFDAAVERKDQTRLADLLQQIQRVEGRERGALWCYGQAARCLLLADTDKTQLAVARNYLAEALVQRPRWARAFVMMAEVEQRQGNLAAATERYESAVEMGDRNPEAIRNLVLLLYKRQRFSEADQVLRNLEAQQTPFSPDLDRLASAISWRAEDSGRALELATKAAESAKTVDDFLWLGQLQTVLGRTSEAEQTFRKATQVAPQELRAWQALVQYAVRQKSPEMVEQILKEADGKISPDRIAMVRAQALTALGKFDKAAEEYERAMQLKPDDSKVIASAAEFFLLRQDITKAESLLRKLLQGDIECTADERIVARRQLAILLAHGQQYPKIQEALHLVEQNQKELSVESPEDLRVQAIVTAALPGHESRTAAIDILKHLTEQETPQPGDHFLLAQLYEADGHWSEARRELQSLMTSATETPPLYLASYIRGLLDHKDLHEAKLWLARWQNLHPDDTTTIEFQAEVDTTGGQVDQAINIINKQIEKLATPSAKLWGATLLERLAAKNQDASAAKSLNDAAEQILRSIAQQDPRQRIALADFLARHGRVGEAVDLCLPANSSDSSNEALLAAVGAVCQPKATPADRQRVEQAIRQSLDVQKDQTQLLTALGTLYESQNRYDEAIKIYRHALEIDPSNVVALNNLSLLLAHNGQPQPALDCLKQALQIVGPRAELMDSEGTVQLASGDADQAIADFSAAVADKPSATRWLHLAIAQFRAQHIADAQNAFEQALALGLKPDQIHPFDQADFATLNSQFAR